MTPIDALKAGVKTSVVTFLSTVVVLVVGLLNQLAEWSQAGNPPDIGNVRGLFVAAVLALCAGVLNSLARFAQVAGVPFIGGLVTRLLGAVPTYPEPDTTKVVPPKGS